MRWSWRLGTFRGIEVYIHTTFLLLVAWILISHLARGAGLGMALGGVLFILLLFGCVLLHEFGHALTAQRYGIRTRDITLYPIGGIARLERIPRDPKQELVVALAGPAVNVVIAAALWLYLSLARVLVDPLHLQWVGGNLAANLMMVNVTLAVFNLLPAFPMDGGRVLRAFLAQRMEYGRATQKAAAVGQGMAFLFGLLGLLTPQPMLLFIAFFVYMGAAQEASTVQAELAFRGVPVRDAMMTRFHTLHADEPLAGAVNALLAGAQHDFPVLDNDRIAGILTRSALIDALSKNGPAAAVGTAMQPAPAAVRPEQSLEATFQQMREEEAQTVPVVEEGRLVGLVTLENIGEFLMVRSALEGPRQQGGATAKGAAEEVRGGWSPRDRGVV